MRGYQASLKKAALRLAGRGARRESLLVKLLARHFRIRHRLDWELSDVAPHFYDFRGGVFELAFADAPPSSHILDRAAMARDCIADGGRVLDIGCGDGFFTRRFYCDPASRIDAIDIEESAIAHAQQFNAHTKISYLHLDAVQQAFPNDGYDVVIWNGALGHFSERDTSVVMGKIRRVLGKDGVFVGSESLGTEGHDHFQFFADEDAVQRLFLPYFTNVATRTVAYTIGADRDFSRREVFWKCSDNEKALTRDAWQFAANKSNAPRAVGQAN